MDKTFKMKIVRFLRQVSFVDAKISRNNDELKKLRNMKTPGNGDQGASWSEKVAERISELEAENAELMDLREEVIKTINRIRDIPDLDYTKAEKYILVLKLRYINGRTWPDIGRSLSYVQRHVREIHDEALAFIKLPEDERPP